MQAVLGSASAVLVAVAGGALFRPRAGLVPELMLALYAPAIFFDSLIQKSVLAVVFVSAARCRRWPRTLTGGHERRRCGWRSGSPPAP